MVVFMVLDVAVVAVDRDDGNFILSYGVERFGKSRDLPKQVYCERDAISRWGGGDDICGKMGRTMPLLFGDRLLWHDR